MKNRISCIHGVAASCIATIAPTALAGGGAALATYPDYRSTADSPAFIGGFGDNIIVNTFEDGLLTDGLALSGTDALVVGNSVEQDGVPGHSLQLGSWAPFVPAGVSMAFSAVDLGGSPSFVAFAITDASGVDSGGKVPVPVPINISVTAFLADGSVFSQIVPVLSNPDDVTDDTLIALDSPVGILSVELAAATPIWIDHVQYNTPAPLATSYVRDDIDGDGKGDIVWTNGSTDAAAGWLMDGLSQRAGGALGATPAAGSFTAGLGDIDGNGRADVVWRDGTTGALSVWFMDGFAVSGQTPISGPLSLDWEVVAIGDINADKKGDIIFRHNGTGEVRAWLMDGATRLDGGVLGTADIEFIGIGDLNADNRDDLVWREGDGAIRIWLLDGLSVVTDELAGDAPAIGTDWQAAAVGDLDGNGRADIIWVNRGSHSVHAWFMDGTLRRSGGVITNSLGMNWSVIGTADVNDDGRADVLWRNMQSGDVNIWLMDGLAKLDGGFVKKASMQWQSAN